MISIKPMIEASITVADVLKQLGDPPMVVRESPDGHWTVHSNVELWGTLSTSHAPAWSYVPWDGIMAPTSEAALSEVARRMTGSRVRCRRCRWFPEFVVVDLSRIRVRPS